MTIDTVNDEANLSKTNVCTIKASDKCGYREVNIRQGKGLQNLLSQAADNAGEIVIVDYCLAFQEQVFKIRRIADLSF